MIKLLCNVLTVCMLLILTSTVYSQEEKTEFRKVHVSNNFENSSELSIHIKWFAKGFLSEKGFNVYRKSENQNSKKSEMHCMKLKSTF